MIVKATNGQTMASTNSTFITGLLSSSEWAASKWITGGNAANQLRKQFDLPGGTEINKKKRGRVKEVFLLLVQCSNIKI